MVAAEEEKSIFRKYWWFFLGLISAVSLSTALNISNTDGWIVVTSPSNDSFIVNWNTTRPVTCASGNYSYWTGTGFACRSDQTGGSVNLSGYVPYTGATQNVNINGYILQTHGVRSTDSAGLLIESASGTDSAVFGVANTANILFYGSLDMSTGTNICLGGVCRGAWTADTYANVTALQTANTTTNARIDSVNSSVSSVSTLAQTKAATGSATSSTLCLQNLTVTNATWTSQYTTCGGAGGGVTQVNTGNGLTGGPITSTGTISVNSPTCGAGEYLTWSGTAFSCSTPAGGSSNTWTNWTSVQYSSVNNTLFTPMANLTATLQGNSSYIVKCEFLTQSAAATTGEQLQINITGSPTTFTSTLLTLVGATTISAFQGTSTTSNTYADTGSAGVNLIDIGQFKAYVVTGANPVTLNYFMRSEVALSNATYQAGSSCVYTKVR